MIITNGLASLSIPQYEISFGVGRAENVCKRMIKHSCNSSFVSSQFADSLESINIPIEN
jgi:hypothetical protein